MIGLSGVRSWWEGWWPLLPFGAGLRTGAGLFWLGMRAESPSYAADRLAYWAKRYCQMSDVGRALVDRGLFYQLPSSGGVVLRVECAR